MGLNNEIAAAVLKLILSQLNSIQTWLNSKFKLSDDNAVLFVWTNHKICSEFKTYPCRCLNRNESSRKYKIHLKYLYKSCMSLQRDNIDSPLMLYFAT